MQKITPFLWFDTQAEEAAEFYLTVFKNSRPGAITHYGAGSPGPEGSVMTAEFEIEGIRFIALNGGPVYKITPAVSFVVYCDSQEEVDYYWEKLSADPANEQCGWLKDRFGVSWQIVPTQFIELIKRNDSEKTGRMMQALMTMKKLDIATLERAYYGE